jgi:hypothetical protein
LTSLDLWFIEKDRRIKTDSEDRAIIGVAASRGEVIVKQCPSALNPVAFLKNESNPAGENMNADWVFFEKGED